MEQISTSIQQYGLQALSLLVAIVAWEVCRIFCIDPFRVYRAVRFQSATQQDLC